MASMHMVKDVEKVNMHLLPVYANVAMFMLVLTGAAGGRAMDQLAAARPPGRAGGQVVPQSLHAVPLHCTRGGYTARGTGLRRIYRSECGHIGCW
jgi:hypothetical protein